jgi:hypothetical protein
MNILITDVTEMGGGNYCVAGWCAATQSMVRPLPNGANWSTALLHAKGIAPGVTVDVQPNGNPGTGVYPHTTEDTPIDPASVQIVNPGPPNWFGAGAPPTAATVQDAFQNSIQHNSQWNGLLQGVHVLSGTQTRSLWAVRVARNRLDFFDDFDKLKVELDDGDARYSLSVSARALKEAYRQGGVAAAEAAVPNPGQLHVRLGLARAWHSHPNKCFLMVNGVYW